MRGKAESGKLTASANAQVAGEATLQSPRQRDKADISIAFGVVCLALLAGCGAKKEAESEVDRGMERTVERGPHAVVMRLDRGSPTVADRVHLEVEVTAAEEWKVVWPVVKGTLDEFQVVDQDERQPELLPDGRTRRVRTYVLEPFLAGTYTIPPLEFRFEKEGGESQRLETGEVKVEVRSLLEEGAAAELHDIAPPVSLREKPKLGWLGWLLGGALLAGAAIWWWRRRVRREAELEAAPRRPAHEIAFEELEALLALDLPGRGETKRFFQELSLILRRYVENRFGVHAPGQTTEEFLVFQSRSGLLELRHQELLKDFLLHCDLVKFAEMEAGPEQARKAFEACRSFVSETKLEAETVEKEGPARVDSAA